MARLIEGLGTPESRWQAWAGLATLDAFDLHPLPARAVVVAPHPDDEVLGAVGIMALLAAAGVSVRVVAVSDGEASHPHSPTITPAQLAGIRRAEQHLALARLGLTGPRSTVAAYLTDTCNATKPTWRTPSPGCSTSTPGA